MTVTKSEIPSLLGDGLKAVFFEAFGEKNPSYRRVATVIESNGDSETYPWLGSNPMMREFVDERMPDKLDENSYTIKNKTWEATIAVDRAAIEDDKLGQIKK